MYDGTAYMPVLCGDVLHGCSMYDVPACAQRCRLLSSGVIDRWKYKDWR